LNIKVNLQHKKAKGGLKNKPTGCETKTEKIKRREGTREKQVLNSIRKS